MGGFGSLTYGSGTAIPQYRYQTVYDEGAGAVIRTVNVQRQI
jgi:hypothetical protein